MNETEQKNGQQKYFHAQGVSACKETLSTRVLVTHALPTGHWYTFVTLNGKDAINIVADLEMLSQLAISHGDFESFILTEGTCPNQSTI
jgi:hypothetical protein